MPSAPPPAPDLALDLNIVRDSWRLLGRVTALPELRAPVLGLSWFWLVGATYLAQLPALTKHVIGGDEQVVTLFLTTFSVGIGLGSLLCNRLLRGAITLRLVPIGALGISVFTIDLYFACASLDPPGAALMGLREFLATVSHWRGLIDLFMAAVAGGLYTVPLYAVLQVRSAVAERSRVIAGANIMNALFMVAGALVAAALLSAGISVPGVLLVVGIANLGVVAYAAMQRRRGRETGQK